jgi:hypothetical protein
MPAQFFFRLTCSAKAFHTMEIFAVDRPTISFIDLLPFLIGWLRKKEWDQFFGFRVAKTAMIPIPISEIQTGSEDFVGAGTGTVVGAGFRVA